MSAIEEVKAIAISRKRRMQGSQRHMLSLGKDWLLQQCIICAIYGEVLLRIMQGYVTNILVSVPRDEILKSDWIRADHYLSIMVSCEKIYETSVFSSV